MVSDSKERLQLLCYKTELHRIASNMNEQKQPLVQNFEYLQSSPQVCTVNFSIVITFLNRILDSANVRWMLRIFSHRCQNQGFYSLHLSVPLIFALNINLCPLGWHEMGQEGGNEGLGKGTAGDYRV